MMFIAVNMNETSGADNDPGCLSPSTDCQECGIWRHDVAHLLNFLSKRENVDYDRINKVGSNLACAEWLLVNGAGVRFANQHSLITDYNELMALEELPESADYKIEEIYANKASISHVGFRHLKGCNRIKRITLIFCTYVTDEAIFQLSHVSDSLKYLEIRACYDVTDEGILSLAKLRNLDELILENLIYLKRKEECETTLRKALPNTKIKFQPDS